MARFNLNLSDAALIEVNELADRLDVSMADVLREAYNLLRWLTREMAATAC